MLKLKAPELVFTAVFLCLASPAWGQASGPRFSITGTLDWGRAELRTEAGFSLAGAGTRLPSGRFMAEETLKEAYPRLLRPCILSIRVDSGSTVRDLVDQGRITLGELDSLCLEAGNGPPSLSPDLERISSRSTVLLEKASAFLMRHRRAIEPERPMIPAPAADYTGIIVIAEGELPVHGRNTRALAVPCLFPEIRDTDMNLIYEKNMLAPPAPGVGALMVRYAGRESIFRPTPSGLDGETAALLGNNPLRIIARGLFGITPTDPVIDRGDALKILSTEGNRRLLREGRVLFVVNQEMLSSPAGS